MAQEASTHGDEWSAESISESQECEGTADEGRVVLVWFDGLLLQPAAAAQFDNTFNMGEISGDARSSMAQREFDGKCCKISTREERQ
jgi:hypothetical protein